MLQSSGIMARTEGYSMPYGGSRGLYPLSNSGYGDISRYAGYASGRTLEMPTTTPTTLSYGHPSSMMVDPTSTRPTSLNNDTPPFNETLVLHPIMNGNQTIRPEIIAKIHKGFFQVDEKWTCYRRNYFSVSCSFALKSWIPNGPLYLQLSSHTAEIRSFAMSISAIVNGQDNETRELVQHTPKRDKQSERKPGKIPLSPTQPPSLHLSRGTTSNQISFGVAPQTSPILDYNSSYGSQQQSSQPPTSHTFERIQFQKATANNGKRRAQQQYYNLVVELFAEVSHNGVESQWVLIGKRLSHPMVVRGRSPGHYKDARRDSTSMGPGGDSGGSGEGPLGNGLGHGIGPSSRAHLSLLPYTSNQRNGTRYDYRQMTSTEHSPLTASPLVSSSSSSSPGFDYTVMNESMHSLDTIKDANEVDAYGQHAFSAASSAPRKMAIEPSNLRAHLPGFEEERAIKSQEHEATFGESYDPVISMLHNDHDANSHYDKRNGAGVYMSQTGKHSPVSKLNSSFLSRPAEPFYGRFDVIHNPQSLCS